MDFSHGIAKHAAHPVFICLKLIPLSKQLFSIASPGPWMADRVQKASNLAECHLFTSLIFHGEKVYDPSVLFAPE